VYVLERSKADAFFGDLCRGRIVYALEACASSPARSAPTPSPASSHQYHLTRSAEWLTGKHTLGAYRPVEPLKAVVFPPRLSLGGFEAAQPVPEMPEQVVVGVKNCDLSALRVHDWVFLENEPQDPFYAEARKKTLIVACDCADALDVCFCSAVREQPYAKAGFDVNLSPVERGYVVEAGSAKGGALLDSLRSHLAPADAEATAERERNREQMTAKVREQAERAGLRQGADFQKAVREAAESDLWGEFAEDCVECGACNFACCTCHCFLLADGRRPAGGDGRTRLWDSCLYRDFARVAGGANPRKHRAERLYNRFDKKFVFFPEVRGYYACDGCGRCVEACTGRIDIREVLKRAVDER